MIKHDYLDRLFDLGVVNGQGRGASDPGGHGSGRGGNGNGATGGGNKSMNGRGGQNDVNGAASPTGDSADNGSHTGRNDDRTRTNPMAAARHADTMAGLVNEDARRHESFDRARHSFTATEEHSIADTATAHVNKGVNAGYDAASLLASSTLSPAAGLAVQGVKSYHNAKTKAGMMEALGETQTAGDVASETARGFVPGLIASLAAPAGAMLGGSMAGQYGAMVGSKVAKTGIKTGLETAMSPENMANSTPNEVADKTDGGTPSNVATTTTPATPVERAKSAFGFASIDTNDYSSGLINAKS